MIACVVTHTVIVVTVKRDSVDEVSHGTESAVRLYRQLRSDMVGTWLGLGLDMDVRGAADHRGGPDIAATQVKRERQVKERTV